MRQLQPPKRWPQTEDGGGSSEGGCLAKRGARSWYEEEGRLDEEVQRGYSCWRLQWMWQSEDRRWKYREGGLGGDRGRLGCYRGLPNGLPRANGPVPGVTS